MIILAVIPTGVGSTQGITNICPERGICREGFRGIQSP